MVKMHSLIERVQKFSKYLQMEEMALDDVCMLCVSKAYYISSKRELFILFLFRLQRSFWIQ